MDDLFSVVSLTSEFSIDSDVEIGGGDKRFLVSKGLVGISELESLMFGADVAAKQLLSDSVPFVVVPVNDCSSEGFVRVFENVYFCSMMYSVLGLTKSEMYLLNKSFCSSCLSLDPEHVPLDVFRSVSSSLLSSSSWIKQQYNEKGLLCYGVQVAGGGGAVVLSS